jgi:hypothetical protein
LSGIEDQSGGATAATNNQHAANLKALFRCMDSFEILIFTMLCGSVSSPSNDGREIRDSVTALNGAVSQ